MTDSTMYRKRERTQNWSLEEKMYLLELVKSRLDVLENKRIDSASSAMKGLAWQDIHAGFAARFGNDRDAHRVREQWRRMKGQSRTEMLEFAERIRNYGAEVANQRRPSALAEEVWNTLEMARKMNVYHQGSFNTSDDMGSPANLDDDDDDGEDMSQWKDDNDVYMTPNMAAGGSRTENGVKTEVDTDMENDTSGQETDKVDDPSTDPDRDGQVSEEEEDGDDDQRNQANFSGASTSSGGGALMNMLRPKVELNDVPELDNALVPSGLSITAVRVGNSGQKRRAVVDRVQERLPDRLQDKVPDSIPRDRDRDRELRPPIWDSSHLQTPIGMGPGGPLGAPNFLPSIMDTRKQEQRRKIEIMEAEHWAKMELLRVEKETAEIKRRIALRDEMNPGKETSCRFCGTSDKIRGKSEITELQNGEKPERNLKEDEKDITTRNGSTRSGIEQDHDNDGSVVSAASDEISRGSSSSHNAVNGAKDDGEEGNEDQVRYSGGSGGLGEAGSGAGRGGGGGGSIRDAGGSMGKREAALEEEYFYRQQKEQLQKLKHDLTDEISFHEEQIKRHQEAIQRHKQRVTDLDKQN